MPMTTRLIVLTCCLLVSSGYIRYNMEPERVPLRQPLSLLPDRMGTWTGGANIPLTDEISTILGVDDYVNRVFRRSSTPGDLVSLYIGYYESQRQGDTIHSPMNCLPGAGWLPISTTYAQIQVPTRSEPVTVKRVVIEKGLDRQVVLYWYHSHGRVIGNEYISKVTMVYDAVRLNRSDAALVRVVSPVGRGENAERVADERAVQFVQALFVDIDQYLPL
jgi:EpsI family protein